MIKSLIIAKERIVGLDVVINVSSSYLLNLGGKLKFYLIFAHLSLLTIKIKAC